MKNRNWWIKKNSQHGQMDNEKSSLYHIPPDLIVSIHFVGDWRLILPLKFKTRLRTIIGGFTKKSNEEYISQALWMENQKICTKNILRRFFDNFLTKMYKNIYLYTKSLLSNLVLRIWAMLGLCDRYWLIKGYSLGDLHHSSRVKEA